MSATPSIAWFTSVATVAILAFALVWYDQHRHAKRSLEPLERMRKNLEELQRGLWGRRRGW